MEQRRLRLGDILDDYCPRERRVTNHAIVAMIEDDVKQTRCTTCDAEHPYKGGQAPRRRRKDAAAVLYKEVLAGMGGPGDLPAAAASDGVSSVLPAEDLQPSEGERHLQAEELEEVADVGLLDAEEDRAIEPERPGVDEGPIHRRLIRATLPRPEGQKEVRQAPDFTMHGNRPGGGLRGDRSRGGGGNGMRRRFGGHQGGQAHGRNGGGRQRQGFGDNGRGPGGSHGRPQGGRKRSR